MLIIKRFSSKILNTNDKGFIRGRKYDTDLDRLGRMKTSQRELHKTGELGKELRNLQKEKTEINSNLRKETKQTVGGLEGGIRELSKELYKTKYIK